MLGMKIIVAGRKGASGPAPEGRVSFDEAMRTATVVVLCCPLSPETTGLISSPEFGLMREDAVVVNVARGGVVDEAALLAALKDGKIAGAGVDVFAKEPASPETSPLLGDDTHGLNLVTTPHTAWLGGGTVENYQRVLQENVDGFLFGKVAEDRIKV
jgi:glycerate dehydrogenase